MSRIDDIDLSLPAGGHKALPEGYILMEIKTMYGYPVWLTQLLSKNRIYKSSFSKYGCAYKETIIGRVPEEFLRIENADRTVEKLDYNLLDQGGAVNV